MSAPAISLFILSQPACVQCNSTYRKADKKGISYTSFNVSDPNLSTLGQELHAEAKSYGYMQAPIGIVKDADGNTIDHWSGFRPDKIDEYALALIPAAPVLELAAA